MRRSDGAVLWHHPRHCLTFYGSDVIVRNGLVYVVGSRSVQASWDTWTGYILSQQTGAELRTFETTAAPAVGTGNFLTANEGWLLENRTADGATLRWRRPINTVEAPVIAGQTALVVVREPDPNSIQAPGTGFAGGRPGV